MQVLTNKLAEKARFLTTVGYTSDDICLLVSDEEWSALADEMKEPQRHAVDSYAYLGSPIKMYVCGFEVRKR